MLRFLIIKKYFLYNSIYFLLSFLLFLSCSSYQNYNENVKNPKYSDIECSDWLQIEVSRQDGVKILFFQVFDQIGDIEIINSYKNQNDRFRNYPAKIEENQFIWILVNNRFEIRLIIETDSNEYHNTEKLKQFLSKFNYSEMEKSYFNKLNCEELKKFIPVL
jgi:hypothetical protein